MHVRICYTKIFSKPPDTMEEFRVQMRCSLRIVFFIRTDSWNSEEEKGSQQVKRETLLARMAMELQVKIYAHEYFYLKGLVVLLSYQNFWVWWCYESELVSSIHSYWRKQQFLWCQRCKMTSSLPATQHHEIPMLALDESHDSQSAVLSLINNFLIFFAMRDPNTGIIPLYQSLPHPYRTVGWKE